MNFRQSVVGGLGYCGLDRRREPLSGDERRGCWTGASDVPGDGVFAALLETTQTNLIDVRPVRGGVRPVSGR